MRTHIHRFRKIGRFGEAKICTKCGRTVVYPEELHKSQLIALASRTIGEPTEIFNEEEMALLKSFSRMDRLLRDTGKRVRLVFCEADKRGNKQPVPWHVAIQDSAFITVCHRPVAMVLGHHETDTVSRIECADCRAWVDAKTF